MKQAVVIFSTYRPIRLAWQLLLLGTFLVSCQPTSPDVSTAQELPTTLPPDATTAPPLPPPNSYLAQLPPDATNQLVNLGINIVIPTYLTSTMTLANYGVGEASGGGSAYYWLVYRDNQNRCFAIEYASNGIKDISLENKEPLDSTLFGEGYNLYHGKFPNGGEGELPKSDLFTDWLVGEDGFYRLIGSELVNAQDYGQGDCSNITVEEAIAITESLSYLPTDIKTIEIIPPQSDSAEEGTKP